MAKGSGTTRSSASRSPRGLNNNANKGSYNRGEALDIQKELNANLRRFGTSQGTYTEPDWRVSVDDDGYRAVIFDRGNSLKRKLDAVAGRFGLDVTYDGEGSDSFSSAFLLKKKR